MARSEIQDSEIRKVISKFEFRNWNSLLFAPCSLRIIGILLEVN
jgi:hypothetical protein